MSWLKKTGLAALTLVFVAGCASSAQKARREQRDKAVQTAKLYCEFLNGEQFPDLDVALNLAMAQKCDSEKTFSISSYKTPAEIPGMMFCCSVHKQAAGGTPEAPAKLERPVGKGAKTGEKSESSDIEE